MDTYYLRSNLNHDGIEYKAGDTIELAAEIASPLVEAGVLQSEKPEAPAPEQEATEESPSSSHLASAGGETTSSGEPSLDRQQEVAPVTKPAKDVTPEADQEPENAPETEEITLPPAPEQEKAPEAKIDDVEADLSADL